MPAEPMLFVADVEASSRFYQALLGARSGHGEREFERIVDAERALLLQLHRADAEEHGRERLPPGAARGAGVLLYFRVPDVQAAYSQALALQARTEGPPAFIEQAGHTECVVHDPDGYAIAPYQRGRA